MSYASLSSYDQDDGNVLLQGFDEDFDPPAPDVYECPICLLVLRMPMQTECGHRFCKGCILKVVRYYDKMVVSWSGFVWMKMKNTSFNDTIPISQFILHSYSIEFDLN